MCSFTTPESDGPVSRVKNWGDEVEAEEMRSNVRRDMHRSVASLDINQICITYMTIFLG